LPVILIDSLDSGTPNQLSHAGLTGFGATGFSVAVSFFAELVTTTLWRLAVIDVPDGVGLDAVAINIYASTSSGVLNDYFGVAVALLNAGSLVGFAGYDSSAATPLTYPNAFDGQPHSILATVAQDGADVDLTLVIDGQTFNDTATSVSLGAPIRWRPPTNPILLDFGVGTDAGAGSGTLGMGHVAIWDGASVPTDPHDAMLGYVGEQAHARFERICAEEGIPYSGTATESIQMGSQPVADVMAVLRDCEDVDHGMLIEDFAFGLNYRAMSQRVNQAPAMTIDLSTYRTTSGTQGEVLTPVRNDSRLRNEWTITRPDGSTKTAKDEAHQARRGRYNDSATVNVETDDDVIQEAHWRVHEGTFDGLRYETIPVDLGANE
jgi:hypothetical protein